MFSKFVFIVLCLHCLYYWRVIAIAIWNFRPDTGDINRLELLIGEPVHICEESEDWYYGYSLIGNSDKLAIFPKSHATAQDYEMRLTKQVTLKNIS